MLLTQFQSTLPQGERRPAGLSFTRRDMISIHAPARGATGICIFNEIHQYISIHAPARGATHSWYQISAACTYFNPRSRKGSDALHIYIMIQIIISIHAPARGATTGEIGSAKIEAISIHAPARGATDSRPPAELGYRFQSTLPQGERLLG